MKRPCEEESAHHHGEADDPRDPASTYVLVPAAWVLTLVICHTDGPLHAPRGWSVRGLRSDVAQRERRHGAVSVRAHLPQATGGLNMGPRGLPTVHHECADGHAWHLSRVLEPGTQSASCDCAGPV
jgi:hypothetical protein